MAQTYPPKNNRTLAKEFVITSIQFARLPDGLKGTAQDVSFIKASEFIASGTLPPSLDVDQRSTLETIAFLEKHGGLPYGEDGFLPLRAVEFGPKARSLYAYMLVQNIASITMPPGKDFAANVHASSLVGKAVRDAVSRGVAAALDGR